MLRLHVKGCRKDKKEQINTLLERPNENDVIISLV